MKIFIIVHGFVQGVGYRAFVKRMADKYKVSGTVMNAKDGSVHVLAEAEKDVLELFKDAIYVDMKNGPQVQHIEVFPEESKEFPKSMDRYEGRFVVLGE